MFGHSEVTIIYPDSWIYGIYTNQLKIWYMNVSEGNQISGLPYFQTNPHKGLLIIIGHLRCFCLRRFIQRYCKNQPIWICVISYIYIVYTYKNIHIYIYIPTYTKGWCGVPTNLRLWQGRTASRPWIYPWSLSKQRSWLGSELFGANNQQPVSITTYHLNTVMPFRINRCFLQWGLRLSTNPVKT